MKRILGSLVVQKEVIETIIRYFLLHVLYARDYNSRCNKITMWSFTQLMGRLLPCIWLPNLSDCNRIIRLNSFHPLGFCVDRPNSYFCHCEQSPWFGERCNLNWHSRTRTTYYSTWKAFVNILWMWVSTCFVDSVGDRPGVTNRWSWVVSWHSWFCGWIDSTCIAAAGWGVNVGRMTIVKVAADAGWSSSVCRPTFNSMNHYLRRFGYSCATT